jgi:hypothetical protein
MAGTPFPVVQLIFFTVYYVNGEWLMDVGSPGDSPENDTPNTGRITEAAMDYITTQQAADNWNVSTRWVQALIKRGSIEGGYPLR